MDLAGGVAIGLMMQPLKQARDLVQLGPTLKEYKVPEDGEGGVPRSFLGALGWATATRAGLQLSGYSFVTDVAAGLIRGPMSGLFAPSIHQLCLSMAPRSVGAAEPDWRWSVAAELVAQTPESLVNHAVIAMSTRRTCRLLRLPIAPHRSTLGLFTGFAGQKAISIVGLILYETCHGAVYELISTAFGQGEDDPLSGVMIGFGATMFAGLLTYPLDTVRRRLLIDTATGKNRFTGPLDAARTILTEDGLDALYAGATINVGMGLLSYTAVVLLNDRLG